MRNPQPNGGRLVSASADAPGRVGIDAQAEAAVIIANKKDRPKSGRCRAASETVRSSPENRAQRVTQVSVQRHGQGDLARRHRRMLMKDVLAYRETMHVKRKAALDELDENLGGHRIR